MLSPFKGFAQEFPNTITVFDEILFYDGYAAVVDLETHPVPAGVIRHRNDLYAIKLTQEQLNSFGDELTMNVTIKAACDNYDRIGNINIAFVPQGSETYSPDDVERIEIGRFITPFMNKNFQPDEVPYSYSINNVAQIFKDQAILAEYDIWVELEVFGVPYAAQTQVSGCSGRIDVFYGTLEFVNEASGAPAQEDNFLLPFSFKYMLRDYTLEGTDELNETVKSIYFDVSEEITNAKFYLITSNHGANENGEEYNRRNHYIYLDEEQVLMYKPGGLSCEPFRQYNTQGNGIYGPTPRTDSQWASFSNWCPGDVIPIRIIEVGNLAVGTHQFKIDVPSAVFVNNEGYFPYSLYLQGDSGAAELSLGVNDYALVQYSVSPNPTNGIAIINTAETIKSVSVYNMLGQNVWSGKTSTVDMSTLQKGVYVVNITFEGNKTATTKLVKN